MAKFNVNSNAYIIIYSVVMVVIVAVLLSVTSLSLQERQGENILNEKKQQIVSIATARINGGSIIAVNSPVGTLK